MLAGSCLDEVLVAHYTFGTGGPVVWDTSIYSYDAGKWYEYPIIDDDNYINSKGLRDHIAEKTGKPYDEDSVTVASVDMMTLLLNYGHKEGPEVTIDYEPAFINWNFDPEYVHDAKQYEYMEGSNDTYVMVTYWPLDVSGPEVKITPELQYKFNIFLI